MKNTNNLKVFQQLNYGAMDVMPSYYHEDTDYSPPFNPGNGRSSLIKTIQIINAENGNPLVNANVAPVGVTNQNGEITINASSQSQIFTISYMGFRTHKAAFKDLGSMISLQVKTNNLPPVVINPTPTTPTPPQQKANKMLLYGVIGAAAIFLISALATKPKKKKKSKVITV